MFSTILLCGVCIFVGGMWGLGDFAVVMLFLDVQDVTLSSCSFVCVFRVRCVMCVCAYAWIDGWMDGMDDVPNYRVFTCQ